MIDPVTIFTIAGAIAALISGLKDAGSMFSRWRAKRRKIRKEREDRALDDDLERNARLIRDDYNKASSRLGARFQRGDDISRSSMFKILTRMNEELISVLKRALDVTHAVVNPAGLRNVAQLSRLDASDVFRDLTQRLAMRAPISRPPARVSVYSIPSRAASGSVSNNARDPSDVLPPSTWAPEPSEDDHYSDDDSDLNSDARSFASAATSVRTKATSISLCSVDTAADLNTAFKQTVLQSRPVPRLLPERASGPSLVDLDRSMAAVSLVSSPRLASAQIMNRIEEGLESRFDDGVPRAPALRNGLGMSGHRNNSSHSMSSAQRSLSLSASSSLIASTSRYNSRPSPSTRRSSSRASIASHASSMRCSVAETAEMMSNLPSYDTLSQAGSDIPPGEDRDHLVRPTGTRLRRHNSLYSSSSMDRAASCDQSVASYETDGLNQQPLSFCPAARLLQVSSSASWQSHFDFKRGGSDIQCKTCKAQVNVAPFTLESNSSTFEISSRFLAKSHQTASKSDAESAPVASRTRAPYDCVLCQPMSDLFKNRNELWSHLETHSSVELQRDPDIKAP